MVAENYLSGIFGGISIRQYEEIKRISGVQVAAPIANLGYIAPFNPIQIEIDRYLNDDPVQIYRLRFRWSADKGLTRYKGGSGYVYYTRRHRFRVRFFLPNEILPGKGAVDICTKFNRGGPKEKPPFNPQGLQYLYCFSERSPSASAESYFDFPAGRVGSEIQAYIPTLLAAIDPEQETRLIELDNAVVSGRFLQPKEDPGADIPPTIPVIASTKSYVDQAVDVSVERLDIPKGVSLPRILASRRAYPFVTGLDHRVIAELEVTSASLYENLLKTLAQRGEGGITHYWRVSAPSYRQRGNGSVAVEPVTNSASVWKNPCGFRGFYEAPPGNLDVQFRRLEGHPALRGPGGCDRATEIDLVGRFDPSALPGFSPLSRVPLESYYPPEVEVADAASRRLLAQDTLSPSMNLGGYLGQPPFMFTTLEAAQRFLDPDLFQGADPSAPISVIRVRVAGVTGPDSLSRERIRQVAQSINDRTGLAVDVTAGSSPQPLIAELPRGDFGRPALNLREGWIKKGVAVAILSAIDRKSIVLFFLVLIACAFFIANSALAAVRARRSEIGMLACLGWPQAKILQMVVTELALVGLLAGLLGLAIALLLARALALNMSPLHTLVVVPVAVGLAALAGLVPAVRASRAVPLDALLPIRSDRRIGARSIRGIWMLALANLARSPLRTFLGAAGLCIGIAALTFLVAINIAFEGVLTGTLLGNVISLRVRGIDLLSVGLVLFLGGFSVADVIYLNLRERAPEFVVLRTVGWAERKIARLLVLEGLGIALLGGLLGCVTGVILVTLTGAPVAHALVAAVLSVVAGILVSALSLLVPVALLNRQTPPTVLATE